MPKKHKIFIALASFLIALAVATQFKKALNEPIKSQDVADIPAPSNPIKDKPKASEINNLNNTSEIAKKEEVIVLSKDNHIALNGPVTSESMATLMAQLNSLAIKNSNNNDIYLVLYTPGGSVMDGQMFIDFAKSQNFKIHTLSLFSASMGFHIAQNLDQRYVLPSSTLMSHPAYASGLEGEIGGSLNNSVKYLEQMIKQLDLTASFRMGLSYNDYRSSIDNELWSYGFNTITDKVADKVVRAKCDASLNGTRTESFMSFFGSVNVDFHDCPLIANPLKVSLSNCIESQCSEGQLLFNEMYSNPKDFVKEFIVTNKYKKIFK